MWSGLLTDEFAFSGFTDWGPYANVDARSTAAGAGFREGGDWPWEYLLEARTSLALALRA